MLDAPIVIEQVIEYPETEFYLIPYCGYCDRILLWVEDKKYYCPACHLETDLDYVLGDYADDSE